MPMQLTDSKKMKEDSKIIEDAIDFAAVKASLRLQIKTYKKRAAEVEAYLLKHPDEWGKFQSEFNSEINAIFRDIMLFEKMKVSNGQGEKVRKLERIFISKIRDIFLKGAYNDWGFRKPYGYAGDFKMIDDIYQNNPTTSGFMRLFDNYCMMSAISVAVRNRKEDFKRLITNFIKDRYSGHKLKIMDLASGPCRDLFEILSLDPEVATKADFDCYDHDARAIEYARNLLKNFKNVDFIRKNAVKIALKKDINGLINKKYDLIFSTGLFDYFSTQLATGVVRNLKALLKPGGVLAISTARDKYSNPSVYYMNWTADWHLVYRDEEEFKKIFVKAGFSEDQLKIQYEQQGIMQYIIATQKLKKS